MSCTSTEEPEPGILDYGPVSDTTPSVTTEEWGFRLGHAAGCDPLAFHEDGTLSEAYQRQYDGLAKPAPEDADDPQAVQRAKDDMERGFQAGLEQARTAGAGSAACESTPSTQP